MKYFNPIKPNKEFLERTKGIYLESFRQKFPAAQERRPSFLRHFAMGFATAMSLVIIFSGTAVFANQKNVGVDSMLYPMKRVYESVNLTIASETEKPLLQLEFADRRLEELEQINSQNPESPKAAKLMQDLQASVEDSMAVFSSSTSNVAATASTVSDNNTSAAASAPAIRGIPPQANEPDSISAGSAAAGNATTNSEFDEIKKTEDKKGSEQQRQIQKETDGEKTAVCESFNNLFGHDSSYLGELSQKNPELFEKFKNNCQPLISEEKLRKTEDKQKENLQKAEENRIKRDEGKGPDENKSERN